jgi:hypothetical protein
MNDRRAPSPTVPFLICFQLEPAGQHRIRHKDGKVFTISGKLDYQARDATTCSVPTSVPVKWQLQLFPLDRARAPEDIRHK